MKFSNFPILVTGGAGYIGSVLVGELLNIGFRVRVIDNLMYGQSSLNIYEEHKNFEQMVGDIRSSQDVEKALTGIKEVIHLAAIVGDPACAKNSGLATEVNRDASELLYRKAFELKVERFIFASTCSNYGKMDNGNAYVNESSELKPVSHYARLKVGFEKFILKRPNQTLSPVVLRFATAYGLSPRMRLDLTLNEFTVMLALGKKLQVYGEQFWRPYAHTLDLARACVLILKSDISKVSGRAFNVGVTHENYQKKTLVELILKQLPETSASVEFIKKIEDPRDYRVNFDLIKNTLDYHNIKTVKDGIDEFIAVAQSRQLEDFDNPAYRNA